MPSSLPSPVAAAIGIVPAVLDGVRRLPGRAVQLPVLAVSGALSGMEALRKEYDDLADRGERLVARLLGEAVDRAEAVEERVSDVVGRATAQDAHTRATDALGDAAVTALRPPASFAVAVEEAAEQVVADVAPLVGRARKTATRSTARATGRAAGKAGDTVARVGRTAADAVTQASDKVTGTAAKVADTAGDAAGTLADTASDAAGAVAHTADKVADTAGDAADAVEDAADTVVAAAGDTATAMAETATETADTIADVAERAVESAAAPPAEPGAPARPAAEAPKGMPTPSAAETSGGRVDTAATPSVVEVVEQTVAAAPAGALGHDDLPLPDYDHMTLGSLRGRLRSLSLEQLVQVRTYEKAHADRLPVVTMLDNRIAKLATQAAPAAESAVAAAGPSGPLGPPATGAVPEV